MLSQVYSSRNKVTKKPTTISPLFKDFTSWQCFKIKCYPGYFTRKRYKKGKGWRGSRLSIGVSLRKIPARLPTGGWHIKYQCLHTFTSTAEIWKYNQMLLLLQSFCVKLFIPDAITGDYIKSNTRFHPSYQPVIDS